LRFSEARLENSEVGNRKKKKEEEGRGREEGGRLTVVPLLLSSSSIDTLHDPVYLLLRVSLESGITNRFQD